MRPFVAAACAAALGAAVCTVALDGAMPGAPQAEALTTGDVVGVYNVKFKGDGWAARVPSQSALRKAGAADGIESGRFTGGGRIEIAARDVSVNDGIVTVRVLLDKATQSSLLGGATSGSPAFEATAAVIGNSISLISSGQPNYVNAMVLRFDAARRKVNGNWMAVFPATETSLATQKFATGVSVTVAGRRTRR